MRLKSKILYARLPAAIACFAITTGASGQDEGGVPSDASPPQVAAQVSAAIDEPLVVDEVEALAIDAKIYSETFGVPFEEAARRMAIMTAVEGEVATLENAEGADFAGSYYDNRAPTFELKVKTKKAERRAQRITIKKDARKAARIAERKAARKAQRQAARRADRGRNTVSEAQVEVAEAVLTTDQTLVVEYATGARFSLAELEADAGSALEALKNIDGFQLYYVDVRTNEVVVLVDAASKDPAQNAVSAAL